MHFWNDDFNLCIHKNSFEDIFELVHLSTYFSCELRRDVADTNPVGLSLSQFKNLATLKKRTTTSSYPTRLVRRIENLPSSLPPSLSQRREHTPLLITKESKCPRGKLHRFVSSFFIGTADEKIVEKTGLATHFGIISRVKKKSHLIKN